MIEEPEQFIAHKPTPQPLSVWPDIVLHQPDARRGFSAGLEAGEHAPVPSWRYAGPGAAALALHIKSQAGLVANKTVLDLGSGSGLLAIAAAKLGAAAVFALTPDPFAQILTQRNAVANGVAITFVPTLLHTDIVLVGDVFDDAARAQTILPLLEELSQTGTKVLIGDPFRHASPHPALTEIARHAIPDINLTAFLNVRISTLILGLIGE